MESHTRLKNQTIIDQTANNHLGIITSKVPIHCPPRPDVEDYIGSLTQIVLDRVEQGSSVDLVSMMPAKVSRDKRLISTLIHAPVTTIYGRMVSRFVRRPRASSATSKDRLPILIGCADFPVFKKQPIRGAGIDPNVDGGVHYHGLLVIPPSTRLGGQSAQEHFAKNDEVYRRDTGIVRIDVRPVSPNDVKKTLRYCLKAICRRTVGIDEGLLILPRALSELHR